MALSFVGGLAGGGAAVWGLLGMYEDKLGQAVELLHLVEKHLQQVRYEFHAGRSNADLAAIRRRGARW